MVNKLNEKKNNAVMIAAVVSAFLFTLAALVTGMVLGLNKRHRAETNGSVAQYLLVDSASELNHTMSALRLCNQPETAQDLCNNGLVFAVRAETALECVNGEWSESRAKEAFLNDVATVLHTNKPMEAVKKADLLFKYSGMFYEHVTTGKSFEYNGELTADGSAAAGKADGERTAIEADEAGKEKAAERIKKALDAETVTHVGGYDGKLEFNVERGGKSGYATIEGDKITEFSFVHGGGADGGAADEKSARAEAERIAEACGYAGLSVCSTEVKNDYVLVKMCKSIDGALACDECASVVIVGGEAVAFTAGKCNCDHDVPSPKLTEREARRAAPEGAKGEGVLVTRVVDGKERICYEYRYDLEDGVHYVYVCAENGKQMQVK
ncbi:MAG: hypothetical protein K2M48_07110 [Clostridiales bacterium]|nr:hypothetical protein [Clostridiales bacterium]